MVPGSVGKKEGSFAKIYAGMSRLPPVSLNRYVWQEAQVQVLGLWSIMH